tara:strand:- start:187 stop:600 length:414 start_codon:yes stop_codon:yes gene_type:complete
MDEEAMNSLLGSMSGTPSYTKDGRNNRRPKSKDEYKNDAIAYKVFFNASHSNSHTVGWMIYVFSLLCLAVGMGLVAGIWGSIPDSLQTESFRNYCYSVWAVLALGIVLATAFACYFYYTMRQFKLVHQKKFHDIWKK